jgi:putative transposase
VTARGVAESLIFVDDADREAFALLLSRVSELWGWNVLAWCLMGTHYHLLVEARQEQMSFAVHRLNSLYAQRFNRRHSRRGHLFENRFSAWVIRDEEHVHATTAYILENPVRAGLCAEPRDWAWSGSRMRQPRQSAAEDVAVAAGPRGLSPGHGS